MPVDGAAVAKTAGASSTPRKHAATGVSKPSTARANRRLDVARTGDVGRDEDHEQGVDLGGAQHQAHRPLEDVGAGRRDQVDRVARARAGQGRVAEGFLESSGELGHLEAGRDAGVGGDDGRTAAVAHDRDASTGGYGLVTDQRRHVEEFLQRVDAYHAGRAQERVDRGVEVGERGGV